MTTIPAGPDPQTGHPQPEATVTVPPGPKLARSAGVIGLATSASRVLGLARDQLLAYLFGAGNAVDAYNVAFRIPNVLRDLFAEGAMSAAFVPTFARTVERGGRASAWRLGNSLVNTLVLTTSVLVIAGFIFATPIVTAFAAEYREVPGKLELTVQLTRIMLPFLTLVAVAAAFMGMLNALHRFFVPALSPAVFNVGSILSMLLLVPVMPALGLHPIAAVAIGVLVGGLGQALVQWPLLHREGFRYRPAIDWRDPGLRQVMILMGPGTVGLAATQINIFVNTVLATGEGTGAVSWLNYAFRLMYLPLGIVGVSIATAVIPTIARHAERSDIGAMRHDVANGLAMMLAVNLPATAGLVALSAPIVRVLFERGAFTAEDTAATAAALIAYAVGLTGYSVVKIATPTFYSLRDARTPVLVTGVTVAVNVALNLLLVRYFSYVGLAAATSAAALLNAATLLVLLGRRLGGLEAGRLGLVLARACAATAFMTVVTLGMMAAMEHVLPGPALVLQIARLAAAILAGVGAVLLGARLVGLTELMEIVHAVRTRRARRS